MTQPNARLSSLFELEYPQSVGVYDSYVQAQAAVDFLADAKFAVQNITIVGTDLKSVERVTGRRNWGTVLLRGLQSGLSTGLMVTFILWFL
ncbi:general stress protein, partial [Micropruina sp.]|uniref:general stress protein n=1 Tax=Micropruina sp. TaxID=2737536 RepID=UPI00344DD80F